MRTRCLFSYTLVLTSSLCAVGTVPPVFNVPRYDIDLDVHASVQWRSTLDDFLQRHGPSQFEATYRGFLKDLGIYLPGIFAPKLADHSAARLVAALERGHPDLVEELQTLSASLLKYKESPVFRMPLLAAATAVYVLEGISVYDITDAPTAACTSTVVASSDGHVLHGRSLDYEPRDAIAATVVEANFHRHGTLQYTCLHPLVYPTALQWFTCQRPGAVSLSVNARSQGSFTEHNTSYERLLERLAMPEQLLLGEAAMAAMDANTYGGALAVLASAPVVSSNYYIIAGAGLMEGSVITRFGNISSADVWALGSGAADGQPSWMRVQTNVDHWTPYLSGAYSTHRRQHTINLLSSFGEAKVEKEGLWQVYLTSTGLDAASMNRTSPEDTGVILRPTTIATVVMSPSENRRSLDARVWKTSPEILPPASEPSIASIVV